MRLPQVTEDWRWYPEKSLPRPWERLRTLGHAGDSPVQITPSLAHEGFHSAKQPFSRHSVLDRRRRVGVHQPRRRRRPPVHEHEWGLADWEGALGKAHATLPQGRTRGSGSEPAGMTTANGGWQGRMRLSGSASTRAVSCPPERRATTCGATLNPRNRRLHPPAPPSNLLRGETSCGTTVTNNVWMTALWLTHRGD